MLSCFLVLLLFERSLSLSDVTNDVFRGVPNGFISAFGDFNADKHTDIFVINEHGNALNIYFGDEEKDFKFKRLIDNGTFGNDLKISSVVPADFDGDLQMDVLLTFGGPNSLLSKIFWGNGDSLLLDHHLSLPSMVDQPLLMDYNADMIPDLFGEKSPGERYFFLMSGSRNFTEVQQKSPDNTELAPVSIPQSSAFLDLNNDLTADLCVVSEVDGKRQLEYWINRRGVLVLEKTVRIPQEKPLALVGQVTFVDLDGNLKADALVPACVDKDCHESIILIYNSNGWLTLPVDLNHGGFSWHFLPSDKTGAPDFLHVYPTLRSGDFNLDGFPDILAVLGNSTGSLVRAVVMYNEPCTGDCGGYSRKLRVDWDTWLEGHDERAVMAAFYDLYDNGVLDVLVSSMNSKNVPVVGLQKHVFVDDACFMKVTVVSGRCNDDCPGGRKPYGVNQPGPVIRYETTDLSGDPQHKIAFQLSQSAYFPLQTPYTIFGLGQTPNFIDKLEVGIPTNTSAELNRDWTMLIPNSQLVIIPYPINDPSSWTNKLFVTPSRLMMLTGAALLGTCGFIAGIVGILHWRDKIEDKKEKRQEAQRFHFDAM